MQRLSSRLALAVLAALANGTAASALPFVDWRAEVVRQRESAESRGVDAPDHATIGECLGSPASMRLHDVAVLGRSVHNGEIAPADFASFAPDRRAAQIVAGADEQMRSALQQLVTGSANLGYLLDESVAEPESPQKTAVSQR